MLHTDEEENEFVHPEKMWEKYNENKDRRNSFRLCFLKREHIYILEN